MTAVGLIARREITSRLQQKGFRIGFGIALLIVVVACVVPSFFSSDNGPDRYDVGLAASVPGLGETLQQTTGATITVHRASVEQARQKVRDGDWDAAVLPGGKLIAQKSGDTVVGVVQAAYRETTVVQRLAAAGLSQAQISSSLRVAPLSASGTDSGADNQRQAIAIVTVVVLFSQLATFCTWAAMGVVEEKSSRVVELVLSSVRPLQLLTGKLLGIGALAAAQVLLIGGVGLAAATAADTISIPAAGLVTVLVGFLGFVLGFAFFGSLAAALGSTVSRQEEVSGILAPVTMSLFVCYGAGFATASSPDSAVSRVLSILPPISCVAMPGRIARGGVPVLDIAVSVVLLLAAAAVVVLIAARIYRASVLHSGTRVSLRTAWRGEAAGA